MGRVVGLLSFPKTNELHVFVVSMLVVTVLGKVDLVLEVLIVFVHERGVLMLL